MSESAVPVRVTDFSDVTERAGNRVTEENLSMDVTRYAFAARQSKGRDVLEVACGAGQGLGTLAASARRVVGGDFTESLVRVARRHYGARVPVLRLDAHELPFGRASFDMVVLYEAIYYLKRPEVFLAECRRVLRPRGLLLICSANREWADFNPSPFATRYYSGRELADLARQTGFEPELLGAFRLGPRSPRQKLVSVLKRTAVSLGLIPKTMAGKEWLKRLFLGRLVQQPVELRDGLAPDRPPEPLPPDAAVTEHKVVYLVGRLS
ncbi:MAG: class I SAM-dependent methyltransferase [Candidatus Riflebacteria bacterium]|nr:class I SAM-dependent methyltransferase [Candidatus Riflebacteria bacterium]